MSIGQSRNLGFGLLPNMEDTFMYSAHCHPKNGWRGVHGVVSEYQTFAMDPASVLVSYDGRQLFEGIKAFLTADRRLVIFRPWENVRRMARGAEWFHLPPVPEAMYLDALMRVADANRHLLLCPDEALYLRPVLFDSGPKLGLGKSNTVSFLIFASVVGSYFKRKNGIKILLSRTEHRAFPGDTGAIKAGRNYSPHVARLDRAQEFDPEIEEILYSDALDRGWIDEVGAGTAFFIKDDILETPPLNRDTILRGVTRDSILFLAPELRIDVWEHEISISAALTSHGMFCAGTAAVVSPVAAVYDRDGGREWIKFRHPVHPIATTLYEAITDIQYGRAEDKFGWLLHVTQ